MKKALLFIVTTVVVLGGVLLVAMHYQNYKNKHQPAPAVPMVPASEVTNVKAAAAGEYSDLQGSYNSLYAECQKGKAAYDALTPLIKNKLPAPNCGPAPASGSPTL